MGFENVGVVWTPQTLKTYLSTLTKPAWCKAVTLHHTWSPSLADRPKGFTVQHIKNLESYYKSEDKAKKKKAWSSGPHLFVDEDQLWGMCDFLKKGVHAVSFNSMSIGIEVLGNYDKKKEDPKSGRGLECWKTAAAATKVILDWLGLEATAKTVLFHNEDPTTSKTCPGSAIEKAWVLQLITGADAGPLDTTYPKPKIGVTLAATEWKFVGERWCVPVMAFLTKKGVPTSTVAAKLKKVGKEFYYDGEWLERAFYDAASASTWAPTTELVGLV
jgi:hypothetical protein